MSGLSLMTKELSTTKLGLFANHPVLLMVPSWHYSPLYKQDEIVTKVDGDVTDAMDDARHNYEEKKASHRWKQLLLEFLAGHELLSKLIYDEAGYGKELTLGVVPFQYSHVSAPSS
jgi:hypothetical protein